MIFLKTATTTSPHFAAESPDFTLQRLRGSHKSVFFFRFVELEPLPIYPKLQRIWQYMTFRRTYTCSVLHTVCDRRQSAIAYHYEGIHLQCAYNGDLRTALQSILQSTCYMRCYFCLVLSFENFVGGEINADGNILT